MKRLILSLLVAFSLAFGGIAVAPGPVSANHNTSAARAVCGSQPYAIIFGEPDLAIWTAYHIVCAGTGGTSGRPDLRQVAPRPSGVPCNGYVGDYRYDMNDCVTSYEIGQSNCHYRFALYADINYSGTLAAHYGNYHRYSWGTGFNDATSSVKWSYRPTCPV